MTRTHLISLILALLPSAAFASDSAAEPDPESRPACTTDVAAALIDDAYTPLDIASETDRIEAGSVEHSRKGHYLPCIYDMPYSISANYPNYHRLAANTALLMGAGATMLIVLEALPADATAWNKREIANVPMFQRWYNHVMRAPVFDKDNAVFNYILHPYAGAAYYMSARSQGFNLWRSWLYTFAISTFFWEYGFEAFNEVPSINDLIITPMGGVLIGELFYLAKRKIVENDYYLLGTRWLGYPVAFLLDPVNECLGWFRGNRAHGYGERHATAADPSVSISPSVQSVRGEMAYGFSLSVTF